MSTLIERIESRSTNGRTGTDSTTPAERLRTTMAVCRVQFTWFGTKKSLTAEQKAYILTVLRRWLVGQGGA